jgi:hypothetical protein
VWAGPRGLGAARAAAAPTGGRPAGSEGAEDERPVGMASSIPRARPLDIAVTSTPPPGAEPPPPASTTPILPSIRSTTPPAPRLSWQDVDDALARGSEGDAEQALTELSQVGSTTDRSKALLGLAQLASSRGDCDRAGALLRRLEALDAGGELARRGRRLLLACRPTPATD